MTEVNKEIAVLSYLTEIQKLLIGDPELSDTIADKLDTLPVGNSMRHILMSKRKDLSYYNEKCAEELRPFLDRMIETRMIQEFRLEDSPGMSLRTLYLKVYQPWLWLIDKHPDKEKYSNLKRDTKIAQRKNGVRIVLKDYGSKIVSHDVDPELDNLMKLQNKISDFLAMELTADAMFDEKRLSLTDEQMDIIRNSLLGLPEDRVKVIVEATRIRILRKV